MEVIEKYILGKYGNMDLCEDAIVVTDDFIAVIDGVSSKINLGKNKKSTGKIASEIIAEGIKELRTDVSCSEAINYLNGRLHDFYIKENIEERLRKNPAERPAACVMIYSKALSQIWSVGDCQALYDGILVCDELEIDKLGSDIRRKVIEFLLATGVKEEELLEDDISKEITAPIFARQPYIRNKKFNSIYDYSVIEGFKIREDAAKIVDIPLETEEIVFASDGYPKIFACLEESEKYLKYIVEEDPLCFREFINHSGKYKDRVSFDDRSYIRFRIK